MPDCRSVIARVLLAGLFACLPSQGQQATAPAPATAAKTGPEMTTRDAPATFSTRVNLVMVPVVVRDGQGRAIGTLRQEDFQLFDKGKPQLITRFSIERPGAPSIVAAQATQENGDQQKPAQAAPFIPERFVAYLFDDVHMTISDLLQARKAMERHFDQLEPASRAAIFTTSGRPMLEFTDDREKLRQALQLIQPWASAGSTSNDCPEVTYYMADLIVNKNDSQALSAATLEATACVPPPPTNTAAAIAAAQAQAQALAQQAAQKELRVGDSETQLATEALKNVVRRLSAAPGSRNLVLVSSGFFLTIDFRQDETDIMDRAIRANITINSVDARGLYNASPEADASQPGFSPAVAGIRSQYARDSALANEDVMAELASATGGTFFHNNNDLGEGLQRVAAQPEFVYVLGFSPQNLKFDGAYHTLKVTLKTVRGMDLQARRGYYAPKHAADPEQQSKDELREAMFSRDEMGDIPVDLNMQFFKSSDVNARLSVVARIDIRHLHFRKAEDRNLDNLTIISGVFDRDGNYLSGVQKTLEMRLRDQTLEALPAGINIKSTFDLMPGTYAVRLVVRDSEGQLMAARNGVVQIP